MDVRCPQCQTLYELETSQLKSREITLKCSQCQHVFKIETRQSSVVQENQRRWMIRSKKTGDILYVSSFDVLHQWLMQGKVRKSDQISRTGKKWVVISEIGEFMPIFQVIDSISNLMGSPEDSAIAARIPEQVMASAVPAPNVVSEPVEREEVTQRARPPSPTPGPQELPPGPPSVHLEGPFAKPKEPEHSQDEWSLGAELGDLPSTTFDQELTSQTELPKSGAGRVVFALLLIAGIAAAGVYFFQRDLLDPVLGPANNEVVALSETPSKEKADQPAEKSGFEVVSEAGEKAVSAALNAAEEQNAAKMSGVMKALRPSIDQALGLATEEAELAAEGGLVEYKLDEAKQALKYNRTAKAISLYEDILKKDGRNADAYVGLGWAYLQEGDNNEAVVKFQRGLELDARNGDALIGLGSAERQRGNLEAAMRAYDLYLGRHPRGDKVSIAQYQLDALKRQLGL